MPRDIPMIWTDFMDEDHAAVVEFADWLATLHRATQLDLVGRIDALNERASLGRIVLPDNPDEPGDLDAIASDPDLYELRWTLLTAQVRQYHAEPPEDPDQLVRLHFHIKGFTTRRDETAVQRQQEQIEVAIDRYKDGESSGWKSA